MEDPRPSSQPEEFHLSIDRDLPLVRADPTQLERAFVNVLENARRHSGGHAVSVRARAVRTMSGEGDRLIVRVVDRGPGIPPAQLERVFEPFYRAGTARGGHRGSGLGLAIARGFLEANGGTLHVESLPGQGATFVFELPLERGAPTPEPALGRRGERAPAPPIQRGCAAAAGGPNGDASRRRVVPRLRSGPSSIRSTPARPRVLVVDDELQILRALRVVLREAGFEVIAAQSAPEALDLAAVRAPRAAIVDLVLPDGDGVEVTRSLREWSDMPILVLSAVGEEEQKVRALEAGADDYITKPFGARELVARLRAALRRSEGAGAEQPTIVADGLEVDLAAHAVRREGEADPRDPDRVRAAAGAGAEPREADDAQGHPGGGVGPGVRGRRAVAAHPHRASARQDRAGGRAPALHPHRPGCGVPVFRMMGSPLGGCRRRSQCDFGRTRTAPTAVTKSLCT